MKLVIYVLCYDTQTMQHALKQYAPYDWARVVCLPSDTATSRYMEGAAFLKTLPELRAEWEGADMVGILSWKASVKIDITRVQQACEEAVAHKYDVLAFIPGVEHLLTQACRSHPRFLEVWVPLLMSLGHDAQDAVHSDMPAFYCNYWAATPSWMGRFLEFYQAAVRMMDTLPCIQTPLWENSSYGSHVPKEQCMRIYGRPYFPHHPFIGERLASFYFWKEKAEIAMASITQPSFWIDYHNWEAQDVQERARKESKFCVSQKASQ